ncbi:MAG: glycosyltransferase family 2 protein [Fibrobacteraceae bacterium]|nr:glycosyltransferase family 2 protein [Fibrobacteraceae bacterium]
MLPPRISIVTPVYNSAKYLRECLDSLVCQTFTDFEVIAVDDGSVDESPKMLDEYAAKDSRFHVIHKVNGGVSAARNDGLESASGDYVLFVDSDDWLEKNALEIMMKSVARDDADVVITDHFTWREKGVETTNHFFARDFAAKSLEDIRKIQQTVLYRGYSPYPSKTCGYMFSALWTKLIRRSLLTKNVIKFSGGLKLFEDGLVALQVFQLAKTIAYRSVPTYHYRILNNSLCHINENRLIRDCEKILGEVWNFIEKNQAQHLRDAYLSRALFFTKKMALRSFFSKGAVGSFFKRYGTYRKLLATSPYADAIRESSDLKLCGNERSFAKMLRIHGSFFVAFMYELRTKIK